MKKKIFMMLILAVISFIGITNVYAEESLKIDSKTYINTGIGTRKEAKFHTNKGYAYCVTPSKKGAPQGTTLSYMGVIDDGGLRYLIKNGGTGDKAYLKTTLAIWLYYNNYLPDTYKKNSSNDIVVKAKALAEKAKSHKNDSNETVKMTVTNSNKTMRIGAKKNYYKSDDVKVTLTNADKYTVSITSGPKGTQILSSDAKVKSTFSKGEKFYIRVPAEKITSKTTIKVKVTAVGSKSVVKKYNGGSYQDLAIVEDKEKTINYNTYFTVTPITRKCEKFNGNYYGKDGSLVTKRKYQQDCETHKCEVLDGNYFGKDGKIVSKSVYQSECEKPKACSVVGSNYYGKNGQLVTKRKYQQDCETHKCEVLDGNYFGKDGKIVTKATYQSECEKPKACSIVGSNYYGKEGQLVTKRKYQQDCEKHVCEILDGNYFSSTGKVVTKATYEKECVHKCQVVDGKYYDKNGNVTTSDNYDKECNKHVCQYVYGNYYDNNGNIVDKTKYELVCVPHSCDIVGNTYFDKNGKETDANTYNLECKTHKCEIVSGNYFGINGEIVSKDTYNDECVPKCVAIDGKFYDNNGKLVTETEYNNACTEIVIEEPVEEQEVAQVPNTKTEDTVSILSGLAMILGGGYLVIRRRKNS